ncbi:PEP-CTERM sorting domain-containing protein [Lacipirellula parvula]|uniref:Ice-binding protein C-terminal domain-containing protein n=1 Tax=Lacipirellula parvula TaxID=2650471 RepID=A0A5K7X3D2_9BACT|nr:PEP-CTERM sorting domain-containing protein [Lacipirellula parvula]BBO30875.1 hypothetical protein PLANPX_0487 [Lacipirellula parvula]
MQKIFSLLTAAIMSTACAAEANAQLVFGFENGLTGDGFTLLQNSGSVTKWVSTSDVIDVGNGFNLLSATQGTHRVAINPWADRDNFGNAQHKAMVLRSPTFQLTGGNLQIDKIGGMRYGENGNAGDVAQGDPLNAGELGSMQRNTAFNFGGAGEVQDGKYMQGFALRDALNGQYMLIKASNVINDGKARPTDAPSRSMWDTITFTSAELAPYANNGRRYQIDFIDSYGEGSWAHIGFDNVRVPGTLSTFAKGDVNGDGATNSADTSILFSHFTSWRSAVPMAKPDGLARDDGDFDGNGDVDGGDVLQHVANIGLTAPAAGKAKLVYNPADGSVSFNASGAAGGKITAFRLLSDAATPFTTGMATLPSVGTPLSTDIASELFWVDTTLAGLTGTVNLGSILSSGLSLAQAEAALASAKYVGAAGTGEQSVTLSLAGAIAGDFNGDGAVNAIDLNDPTFGWKARFGVDLDGNDFLTWQRNFGAGAANAAVSAVPEPSTMLLAGLSLVGASSIRRRAGGAFKR